MSTSSRRAKGSAEGHPPLDPAGELQTGRFRVWNGGVRIANVAIVFTDIIDSTRLERELKAVRWAKVLKAHFEQADRLIASSNGFRIKDLGDGLMVAFKSASDGLDFALELEREPGHELVRIRAGAHIGPIVVESDQPRGLEVNKAARILEKAKKGGGGLWVSSEVKQEIDWHGDDSRTLEWTEHAHQELQGFENPITLWSVRFRE